MSSIDDEFFRRFYSKPESCMPLLKNETDDFCVVSYMIVLGPLDVKCYHLLSTTSFDIAKERFSYIMGNPNVLDFKSELFPFNKYSQYEDYAFLHKILCMSKYRNELHEATKFRADRLLDKMRIRLGFNKYGLVIVKDECDDESDYLEKLLSKLMGNE